MSISNELYEGLDEVDDMAECEIIDETFEELEQSLLSLLSDTQDLDVDGLNESMESFNISFIDDHVTNKSVSESEVAVNAECCGAKTSACNCQCEKKRPSYENDFIEVKRQCLSANNNDEKFALQSFDVCKTQNNCFDLDQNLEGNSAASTAVFPSTEFNNVDSDDQNVNEGSVELGMVYNCGENMKNIVLSFEPNLISNCLIMSDGNVNNSSSSSFWNSISERGEDEGTAISEWGVSSGNNVLGRTLGGIGTKMFVCDGGTQLIVSLTADSSDFISKLLSHKSLLNHVSIFPLKKEFQITFQSDRFSINFQDQMKCLLSMLNVNPTSLVINEVLGPKSYSRSIVMSNYSDIMNKFYNIHKVDFIFDKNLISLNNISNFLSTSSLQNVKRYLKLFSNAISADKNCSMAIETNAISCVDTVTPNNDQTLENDDQTLENDDQTLENDDQTLENDDPDIEIVFVSPTLLKPNEVFMNSEQNSPRKALDMPISETNMCNTGNDQNIIMDDNDIVCLTAIDAFTGNTNTCNTSSESTNILPLNGCSSQMYNLETRGDWYGPLEKDETSTSGLEVPIAVDHVNEVSLGPSTPQICELDQKDGKVETEKPIISYPEEENDIQHPDWDVLRKLETDDARYKQVRARWMSNKIPDPNKDLTYHSFKKQRMLQAGQYSSPKVRALKRPAPDALDRCGRKLARTDTVPCTYFLDTKINNAKREFSRSNDFAASTFHDEIHYLTQRENNFKYEMSQRDYSAAYGSYNDYHNQESFHFMRQNDEERRRVNYDYETRVREARMKLDSELKPLEDARHEVAKFCKFYKGLNGNDEESDPTVLTPQQIQELNDIENVYEQFDWFYYE